MKTPLTMAALEAAIQVVAQLVGRVALCGSAARCPAMEEF
jgi:hypothetical protein